MNTGSRKMQNCLSLLPVMRKLAGTPHRHTPSSFSMKTREGSQAPSVSHRSLGGPRHPVKGVFRSAPFMMIPSFYFLSSLYSRWPWGCRESSSGCKQPAPEHRSRHWPHTELYPSSPCSCGCHFIRTPHCHLRWSLIKHWKFLIVFRLDLWVHMSFLFCVLGWEAHGNTLPRTDSGWKAL